MSLNQAQRTLNQIDKEIVGLEKKMSELSKIEADKNRKINETQRGITKNTSASMAQSKMRQIDRYQKELTKIISDKADVNKKLADKRKKRADAEAKLQKEEASQAKTAEKQQKKIHEGYERQIADLTTKLNDQQNSMLLTSDAPTVYSTDTEEEFDVFISHASEDKESFVDEFVRILKEDHHLSVWYDDISIKWGDPIRTKIDQGVKKSKFGVVVLSRSYVSARKHWTQYELEGLFQLESHGGKLILPIWHDITKQEVQNFSPTLAGKMAMNTTLLTPQDIAEKLKEIVDELGASEKEVIEDD